MPGTRQAVQVIRLQWSHDPVGHGEVATGALVNPWYELQRSHDSVGHGEVTGSTPTRGVCCSFNGAMTP